MIATIHHNGKEYPQFQASGFAARFAFAFAQEVCKGTGYDIGCAKLEWALPGAIPIDITLPGGWSATKLPSEAGEKVDFIFSSHCLEHLLDWTGVLNYWTDQLKPGGVLFLYLPHYDQSYWRPWSNRKHVNILSPEYINDYLMASGKYTKIITSQRDLNHSFMVMAEKI